MLENPFELSSVMSPGGNITALKVAARPEYLQFHLLCPPFHCHHLFLRHFLANEVYLPRHFRVTSYLIWKECCSYKLKCISDFMPTGRRVIIMHYASEFWGPKMVINKTFHISWPSVGMTILPLTLEWLFISYSLWQTVLAQCDKECRCRDGNCEHVASLIRLLLLLPTAVYCILKHSCVVQSQKIGKKVYWEEREEVEEFQQFVSRRGVVMVCGWSTSSFPLFQFHIFHSTMDFLLAGPFFLHRGAFNQGSNRRFW